MSSNCNCSQNTTVVKPNTSVISHCGIGGDPTLNTIVFYLPEAGLEVGVKSETIKVIYDRFIKFCNMDLSKVDEVVVDSRNQMKYYVNGYTLMYDGVYHGVSIVTEDGHHYVLTAEMIPAWSSEDDQDHYYFNLVESLDAACPDIPEVFPLSKEEIELIIASYPEIVPLRLKHGTETISIP